MVSKFATLASALTESPVERITFSSEKNTVSPAGIVRFFTTVVASVALPKLGTKYKVKLLAFSVSSVKLGSPVLHTIIVVTAFVPELVYTGVVVVVVNLVFDIAMVVS